MLGLNDFERAAVDMLLAGDHPVLVSLRHQFAHARLAHRRDTGVGFFCDFDVHSDVPLVHGDIVLGGIHADLEGLAHGAGLLLFVRGGRLMMLEGFSYDEPWPDQIRGFSLVYVDTLRKAELAGLDDLSAPQG